MPIEFEQYISRDDPTNTFEVGFFGVNQYITGRSGSSTKRILTEAKLKEFVEDRNLVKIKESLND